MRPGYNTNETSALIWSAALSTADMTKSKNKTKKSEMIQYPIFEVAAGCVTDPYWKTILHNCAIKKFPRGFVYEDGFLHHRNNEVSIALPDDPVAFAQTALFFFQENGKMYSVRDREYRKKKYEDMMIANLINASNNWTIITRSKNRRATYLRDYVERKYATLAQTIRDELYTQLNVAFETKFITKEHVIFEKGQIVNIDGLDAKQTGIIFTRPIPQKKLSMIVRDTQVKDKIYRHYDNWCKYLEDYNKYIISSAKSSHTVLQPSSYLCND